MRIIKFRGKSIYDGSWIYGDLLQWNDRGYRAITPSEGDRWSNPFDFKVDPKTIGQYTGKKDANGNDIYEGDILDDIFEGKKDRFVVRWYDYSFALFGDDDRYKGSPDYMQDNLIIIGNIHEHPDLLTQKQNGEG